MEADEQKRFDTQYQHHLRALKLRGMSDSTIDVYARAVQTSEGSHLVSCILTSKLKLNRPRE
jgi:hypothetical protein